MPAYVVLLRAINLGPRNKIAMADLRRVLGEAGFDGVQTHLQTGNVVLRSRRRSAAAVEDDVARIVRDGFGLGIGVMARTAGEMARLGEELAAQDPQGLAVGFLKTEPAPEGARRLEARDFGRDRAELRGRELLLRYPGGQGRSKMSGAVLERALGVALTVRTGNVVARLAQLADLRR